MKLCGGDVQDWPRGAFCCHGRLDGDLWDALMKRRRGGADLPFFGACRPRYREAVPNLCGLGIRVAFVEGNWHPHRITMERWENGNSTLLHSLEVVRAQSRNVLACRRRCLLRILWQLNGFRLCSMPSQ